MKQAVVLLLIAMLGMAQCLNSIEKRSLASTLSYYGGKYCFLLAVLVGGHMMVP